MTVWYDEIREDTHEIIRSKILAKFSTTERANKYAEKKANKMGAQCLTW